MYTKGLVSDVHSNLLNIIAVSGDVQEVVYKQLQGSHASPTQHHLLVLPETGCQDRWMICFCNRNMQNCSRGLCASLRHDLWFFVFFSLLKDTLDRNVWISDDQQENSWQRSDFQFLNDTKMLHKMTPAQLLLF